MINERLYLVDNNALAKLSMVQRSSTFFKMRCRLPSEVLHEARGFPDYKSFVAQEYATTPSVLRQLMRVMNSVPAQDTKLVDLYANLGNADPLIIACALDALRENEDKLFGPIWIIVSNDGAVSNKAAEFAIETMTSADFETVIEGVDQ